MRKVIGIPVSNQSKRLPGKPLFEKKGLTLFEYTFHKAANSDFSVFIVTDDKIVNELCLAKHIPVVISPCFTNGLDRIRWLGHHLDLDYDDILIDWQVDYPLFDPAYLNMAVEEIDDDNFFSFAYDQEKKAGADFVKVALSDENIALYFSREHISEDIHVGIYGAKWPVFNYIKNVPLSRNDKRENLEQLRLLSYTDIYIHQCAPTLSINTQEDWEEFLRG